MSCCYPHHVNHHIRLRETSVTKVAASVHFVSSFDNVEVTIAVDIFNDLGLGVQNGRVWRRTGRRNSSV